MSSKKNPAPLKKCSRRASAVDMRGRACAKHARRSCFVIFISLHMHDRGEKAENYKNWNENAAFIYLPTEGFLWCSMDTKQKSEKILKSSKTRILKVENWT